MEEMEQEQEQEVGGSCLEMSGHRVAAPVARLRETPGGFQAGTSGLFIGAAQMVCLSSC